MSLIRRSVSNAAVQLNVGRSASAGVPMTPDPGAALRTGDRIRRFNESQRSLLGKRAAEFRTIKTDLHERGLSRRRLKDARRSAYAMIADPHPRRVRTLIVNFKSVLQPRPRPDCSDVMHRLIADDDRIERRMPHDNGRKVRVAARRYSQAVGE